MTRVRYWETTLTDATAGGFLTPQPFATTPWRRPPRRNGGA